MDQLWAVVGNLQRLFLWEKPALFKKRAFRRD